MKDLSDPLSFEPTTGVKPHGAQSTAENTAVSNAPKIKSFHRRNRAEDVSVDQDTPVDQEPPVESACEVDPMEHWVDDDADDDIVEPLDAPQSKLIVDSDVQLPAHPLPLWSQLQVQRIDPDVVKRSRLPLVDRFRQSESARATDLLRTRLLHTLRAQGWRRVAVASPTSGCGSTWTAVNLAQSLARIPNSRTLLMDLNFRKPGIAKAFGLPEQGDMKGFLTGRHPARRQMVRLADGLAVGFNSDVESGAAELLHNPTSAQVIDDLMEDTRADVALFDLPPVLEFDDLTAFLPQVDGVLLVSDGTKSTAKDLAACEKVLAGHTQLLGVVLNRARIS
ncbi:exopolysaccharide biosynthesis protein [Epibacterium sp. SM1969]|uniref:Exopolysaccharide biosynthesis protein n=1 Tax=Tritonibacter aquimaris TaxID=2663379 RepID=A0A844AV06_9RHOB|nr:CpsD/CapB family tyrosine-protein kinase [Tritonibacter aquimaris]MQY42244.1 exopolysaccharide biosynthesis protein [Tritonibacter aquimaris]